MRLKKTPGFKNLSLMGISNLTGNAISGFFWLYIANILSEESYGELGYLVSISVLTANIALIGGEYVMAVYTAKKQNLQPLIYLISLISGIIGAIVLFIIFNNSIIGLYAIGFIIFNLTMAELQGQKAFNLYSKNFLLQKIFFVVFSLGLYFILENQGILLGIALSYFPFFKRMYISIKTKQFEFKLFKQKSGFIFNNYLIDLSASFRGQIDKLIIAPMFGFAILGNYFLGLQIISILSILPGVIFTYILPMDSTGSSTKNIKILAIIGSFILCICGITLSPHLTPLLFPQYDESNDFIPILSISIIPFTIGSILTSKFLALEKSIYITIGNLISATVFISTVLLLIEVFPVIVLAIAYVSSIIFQTVFLGISYLLKKSSLEI